MPGIRFSIVIACYNQEAFIRETVESALSQRCPDKEIIVVDDCSSDGTTKVLKAFEESINITILSKNSGVYASRNHGASMANGEYLVFLDGDDVLMPWALDVYDHLITARRPQIILGRAVQFHGKPLGFIRVISPKAFSSSHMTAFSPKTGRLFTIPALWSSTAPISGLQEGGRRGSFTRIFRIY